MESGGGSGSQPRIILGDQRYMQAKEGARAFLQGQYKRFPLPTNQHAISLLISQKQTRLVLEEKADEKRAKEEAKQREKREKEANAKAKEKADAKAKRKKEKTRDRTPPRTPGEDDEKDKKKSKKHNHKSKHKHKHKHKHSKKNVKDDKNENTESNGKEEKKENKEAKDSKESKETIAQGVVGGTRPLILWKLPPKEERKAGWAFKYAARMKPLAIQELSITRDKCLVLFDNLPLENIQTIIDKTAVHNHGKYVEFMTKAKKNQQKKKTKVKGDGDDGDDGDNGDDDDEGENDNEPKAKRRKIVQKESKKKKDQDGDGDEKMKDISVKIEMDTTETKTNPRVRSKNDVLNVEDFKILAGPKQIESWSVAKCIPDRFYPVAISTYFWLIEQDSQGRTTHERLMMD